MAAPPLSFFEEWPSGTERTSPGNRFSLFLGVNILHILCFPAPHKGKQMAAWWREANPEWNPYVLQNPSIERLCAFLCVCRHTRARAGLHTRTRARTRTLLLRAGSSFPRSHLWEPPLLLHASLAVQVRVYLCITQVMRGLPLPEHMPHERKDQVCLFCCFVPSAQHRVRYAAGVDGSVSMMITGMPGLVYGVDGKARTPHLNGLREQLCTAARDSTGQHVTAHARVASLKPDSQRTEY